MSGYRFYLDDLLLPVTPGALKMKIKNQNKTVTLINEGEINLLKPPGLTSVSFTALLPNQSYHFARYEGSFRSSAYFLSQLERLKNAQKPFYFDILRESDGGLRAQGASSSSAGLTQAGVGSTRSSYGSSLENIEMLVTLESYQIAEDAGRYGTDISVEIELLQYRRYGTKIITLRQDADGENTEATVEEERGTETKQAVSSYTVQSGDSLWSIAKKILGDESRQEEIYELNKDSIEAEARKYGNATAKTAGGILIYPGQVLNMPEVT